jgi:DNA-binding transcriptional regulator/RsmH inhibitor MraZ
MNEDDMRMLLDQFPDGEVKASYSENWRTAFIGTFQEQIEAGRFALPDPFVAHMQRHDFKDIAISVCPTDQCLEAWPLDWVSNKLSPAKRSLVGLDGENWIRGFYLASMDDEGLIKVPRYLLREAGIAKDILFVGFGAKFRLYRPEAFFAAEKRVRHQSKAFG